MYLTFPPPPQLAAHVRMFWVFEHDVPAGEPYVYRSMADGCAELIFHYKGVFSEPAGSGASHAAVVHAQSSHHRRFLTQESFGIFGAYLYPTALPHLFGLASPDFSNQMPDLASVLGHEGSLLEEQIMTAAGHEERVRLLSRFLSGRLRNKEEHPTVAHIALRHILQHKGQLNVEELAGHICLSTRQFERTFKTYCGFSPKLYTRIIRFQQALEAYGAKDMSLTAIGYACGYYDQSHFIREFRAFSGYHPREYFAGRPEGIEYRE
ncbi:AraC family transcriptional regulator [Chitinophaga lutea]|uniref:AraC family transcriptional regulator n=1 Tax=Chitinophaga lutea TaxID=2488634 RepID=A0A3N4PVB6_9BACT|nr:helix-turn-helix transcriptional regulator [Chitinophaga lutea]RPE09031.1 AraC family transcriptional regulator [Chitinophaga lutea]